jgi:RHS repeat-associated protein
LYSTDDLRIFKSSTTENGLDNMEYYLKDIGEYNYMTDTWVYYVSANERLAKLSNSTPNIYYAYDHLGNTRIAFSPEQRIGDSTFTHHIHFAADYYPYGKILRSFESSSSEEKYLTTQHERDRETGFDYRGARYFDSDIGRFLSLDPLASQYPAWSDYNYVMGNPISLIDPDGRSPKNAEDTNESSQEEYDIIKGENKGGWTKNHLLLNEAFGDSYGFNQQIISASFPSYNNLSSNYLGSNYTSDEVYNKIGGKVLTNHINNPTDFSNSCALRLSYALNYSGAEIPYHKGKTGSGADKLWYFYRVSDIKKYLLDTYGAPTIIQVTDSDFDKKVKNAQGIIAFDVSGWNDASGHVTLWDGNNCGDHCYFPQNLQQGVKLVSVSIWSIK